MSSTVRTARTRGGRAAAAAVTGTLLLAVAACGGGAGDGGGGGAHGGTTSPARTASPVPATSRATGGGPRDERAARAQVAANWEKLFAPGTSARQRTRLLQDGAKLQLLVQALAHDPRAADTSAKVSKVAFTSPTKADVTYTVLMKGRPVVRGAKGTSVLENGTWKASVAALCALVEKNPGGSSC